ncbi:MAG: ABC transporter ATP-binding protein [Thiobacillus sp.]|nr:ABC transporter ATP-binding protein [Thiobacillus sp.]
MSPLLNIRKLSLRAEPRLLVDSLDLTLDAGRVLGILGANGAGKSTLLATLAGLAEAAAGTVELDGVPVTRLVPRDRARHIALLPQEDAGGYFGSVADFVALGRFPHDEAASDIASWLAAWELAALAQRPLASLSGGERQRARLAQLAAQDADIVLLDEPLTHLDPAHQAALLAWARAEADRGRAVALTLHDPNWAACHCDRLLFLYGDGGWRLGTPAELLTPASLEALYGPGTAALWQRGTPTLAV